MRVYYVYIMAGKRNGTLYIGVTNDLFRRVLEHKANAHQRFTSSTVSICLCTSSNVRW